MGTVAQKPIFAPICAVMAGICAMSFTPGLGHGELAFATFPLLLAALEAGALTVKRGLLLGAIAGTVANAIAFYSVVPLMVNFGAIAPPVAAFLTFLLWVWQSAPFAAALGLTAWWMSTGRSPWWFLPAAFTALASWVPVLFPWRIGCSPALWPLWIQMADLGGAPLLDFVLALASCALYVGIRTRARVPLVVGVLTVALPLAYGAIRMPQVRADRENAPSLRVGIVQPSISVEKKRDDAFRPTRLTQLQSMTAALESAGAELVVWPETAYPYRLARTRKADPKDERRILTGGVHGPLLLGLVTHDKENHGYNSTLGVVPGGDFVGTSDKVHLLAFGEFTPLWEEIPAIQKFASRGLYAGDRPAPITIAGARIAVVNCYEDLLSPFVREVAKLEPELIVNVTNDAWFGHSNIPALHQHMSRVRAVETRRDLIRSVNTGVSSHTLATGEDVKRTDTWVVTSFVTEAKLLHGTTVWVRLGDITSWACALVVLAAAARAWGRRRTGPQTSSAKTSR